MNKEDDNTMLESNASSSTLFSLSSTSVLSTKSVVTSRAPRTCSRCANHGLKVKLKGHKRYCKHLICVCKKCVLTAERQRFMAQQTATKRAQKQDDERGILPNEICLCKGCLTTFKRQEVMEMQMTIKRAQAQDESPLRLREPNEVVNEPISKMSRSSTSANSGTSGNEKSPLHPPSSPDSLQPSSNRKFELLLGYSTGIIDQFHLFTGTRYWWEFLPPLLRYALLKNCGDVENVRRCIEDARSDIRKVMTEATNMIHYGIPYYSSTPVYGSSTGPVLGAPTYLEAAPVIRMVPPGVTAAYLGPLSHPFNVHHPEAIALSSPETPTSPPDRKDTDTQLW